MKTLATAELHGMAAIDLLRAAQTELEMIVRFGRLSAMDDLDREHVVTADALLRLVIKAQEEAA